MIEIIHGDEKDVGFLPAGGLGVDAKGTKERDRNQQVFHNSILHNLLLHGKLSGRLDQERDRSSSSPLSSTNTVVHAVTIVDDVGNQADASPVPDAGRFTAHAKMPCHFFGGRA